MFRRSLPDSCQGNVHPFSLLSVVLLYFGLPFRAAEMFGWSRFFLEDRRSGQQFLLRVDDPSLMQLRMGSCFYTCPILGLYCLLPSPTEQLVVRRHLPISDVFFFLHSPLIEYYPSTEFPQASRPAGLKYSSSAFPFSRPRTRTRWSSGFSVSSPFFF